MRRAALPCSLLAASLLASPARAGDFNADPTTLPGILASLAPGDTVHLAPGAYPHLVVQGLSGAAGAPITLEGDGAGGAVIEGDASHNTVEIIQSSYLTLRGLTIDSKGLDGVFGVSAKDGLNNHVHHVTVEGCTFTGQGASQQTVAISTKTPTYGWIIRGNVIDGAGTGLYLGNSDGAYPFVAGLIEGNLIRDTTGYNAQIKWQSSWPDGFDLPIGPNRTILRDNVFIKDDRPSPDGDRPNVLIGGSPNTGAGGHDVYEIYGNLFVHNPREALLQVAGRVTIHDNIFVDAALPAVVAQDHDLPLVQAFIYNNTIYTGGAGIHFGDAAAIGDYVAGNLIFAQAPVDGPITNLKDNLTGALAEAGSYVKSPSFTLGSMDFYPLAGEVTGSPIDLSPVSADTDHDVDFNRAPKGNHTFRGAYAGEGENPGWPLGDGLKTPGSAGGGGAGGAGSGGGAAGGSGGGSGGSGGGGPDTAAGCGCEAAGANLGFRWGWVAAAALFLVRRSRRKEGRRLGRWTRDAGSGQMPS